MKRREFLISTAAASTMLSLGKALAASPQSLKIAMTAADLPTVTGVPSNGAEGMRFLGYTLYDSLLLWDLKASDGYPDVVPGLCTAWRIDPNNNLRWILDLRQGVKFHDGSDLTVDDIIWNLDRNFNPTAAHFDATTSPNIKAQVLMLDRYEKIDAKSFALTTKTPFAFFPFILTRILIVSPRRWEAAGKSWAEFAKAPVGTGPFKLSKLVPAQSIEMVRNETYWNPERVPKLQSLTVYPMPEPTTRMAALRSGQVDWIEVPPPDTIPSLQSAGFRISTKPYPHFWPYELDCMPGSPFEDVRVRRALNYAVDRVGLCTLLNNTATPSVGVFTPEHPYFGSPSQKYAYDPAKAKALLREAGYNDTTKRLKFKTMISNAGSGQMVPIPMNEFLQQNFKEAGIDVEFEVVDWGTLGGVVFRAPPTDPSARGCHALNSSSGMSDPAAIYRFFHSEAASPIGWNWGHFKNATVDALLTQAQSTFDPKEQTRLLAEAHTVIVDEAALLFIVHDLNARAMASNVKWEPARSWFQDFTGVTRA